MDYGNSNYPDAVSPDGKWILCRRNTNTVFIIPPDGNAAPKVLLETNHLMDEFQFSPDGKWVAYNSDESGRWEVYAARFPEMDRVLKLSDQGGCQPIWRQDGGELFYLTPEAKLMSVPLKQGSVLQPGAPRLLFQSDVLPVNCIYLQARRRKRRREISHGRIAPGNRNRAGGPAARGDQLGRRNAVRKNAVSRLESASPFPELGSSRPAKSHGVSATM